MTSRPAHDGPFYTAAIQTLRLIEIRGGSVTPPNLEVFTQERKNKRLWTIFGLIEGIIQNLALRIRDAIEPARRK